LLWEPVSAPAATAFMNANGASACGARPSYFLASDEFSHAGLCDIFQVPDHAHMVFGPVSLIQPFQ
jgi:hypothetical protein